MSTITPQKRLKEFSSKPISIKKQKLVCDVCNIELDHQKKSSVLKHFSSEKHVKNESARETSRTLNFEEDPHNEFRRELVLAFSSANIPLHKLGNTRLNMFLNKYLKTGFNIPSTSAVRRLLPDVYETEFSHLKMFFNNSKVAVLCDETTDSMNRSVFQADPNVREARLPSGLVRGHAYTLTKVEEYDGNKLLRIRNPWGNEVEWNGAWSDNSSEWESLSESDRLDAGLIKVFDGEFWMCLEDFLEHWDSLQICHMTPESFSEHLLENESDNNNLEWHCTYFQSEWIRGK
ncbi:calpain-A isoform X1, partial [Brachionus plicatilis]